MRVFTLLAGFTSNDCDTSNSQYACKLSGRIVCMHVLYNLGAEGVHLANVQCLAIACQSNEKRFQLHQRVYTAVVFTRSRLQCDNHHITRCDGIA